jgi:glycosyltransferase involved in cell wall biosynthesis
VVDPGAGTPWAERANRFLCIGRFHESKRMETVVSILDRVRSQGLDVTLTLVGSDVDADYTGRLRRLAAERPWVTLREDLTQAELFSLMRASRYGIHAMDREHFGMAAAEMARAGCVVFGHASGGLVEVLDAQRELLWDTPERAVQLIAAMLKDEARQHAMSAHLHAHAARFSVERFVEEFRAIVARRARDLRHG